MKLALKITCTLFFVLCIVFFVIQYYPKRQVKIPDLVKTMSQQDREKLSDFFEELVSNHCFGYTLFGNKPISCATYFIRPLLNDVLLEEKSGIVLRNGEKIWMSYKNLFILKNFLVKFYTNQNIRSIYLINKPLFIAQVQENIEYFRQVLGPAVNAESLLKKLEQDNVHVGDLLQNHHGLLGILYGFGKQNAINFQRYSELDAPLYDDPVPPFKLQYEEDFLNFTPEQKLFLCNNRQIKKKTNRKKTIFPSADFKDIRQEYNYLQSKLKYTHEAFALQRFSPPGFRVDPESQETRELLASYKNTRARLAEIYANGNFMEVSLIKLTEQ